MASEKDWKSKYFDSLQQLEDNEATWSDLEKLLRKAVSRLSISAKGLDTRLDKVLQQIQQHSRDKNDEALESALQDLSDTLSKIDANSTGTTADQTTSIHPQILALIKQLHLDSSILPKLEEFKSSMHTMDDEQCINTFAKLLNSCLDQETSQNPFRQVLDALIDKIIFTHGSSEQLNNIQSRLEQHFDSENWHAYLDEILAEIRNIISGINNEKIELESLIVDVSRQLNEISDVLTDEHSASLEGRKETQHLQEIMNESVENIQSSVDTMSDMDELKTRINHNINSIKLGMEDFIEKDGKRFEESERRNEKLQQQIKFMEHESAQLKSKLSDNRQKLMFDALTGARSRLSYDEILDQELSRWARYQEQFSFAIFDIDHFKQVNDSFGHNAGDKALRIVAKMMKKHIRQTDFLFRIGGEEFVLLLPKTELENAVPLVEKIRKSVSKSNFHFKQDKVELTMSAGLTAILPSDNAERVYERADKALYEAKEGGRNQLIVRKH